MSGACAELDDAPLRRTRPRVRRRGETRRWSTWLAALATAPERRRQRRRLLALAGDPDFLHDIGISRVDALREAGRPFWE